MRRTRKRTVQASAGDRYSQLTIIKEVEAVILSDKPARQVLCVCDCGTEKVVRLDQIRREVVKSCGCLLSRAAFKHGGWNGGSRTPTYRTWLTMRSRCLNANASDYDRYGGRGITICERWSDYSEFLADMGERPSESHSIDRIDPNGHYEPSNCRWATMKEQGRNRRNNRRLTHGGETLCVAEWSDRVGLSASTISRRLARGYTVEEALTIPKGGKNRAR